MRAQVLHTVQSAVGLKENPRLNSSGPHFPVIWGRKIVTAYPFLVPKRSVTHMHGGMGVPEGLCSSQQ